MPALLKDNEIILIPPNPLTYSFFTLALIFTCLYEG